MSESSSLCFDFWLWLYTLQLAIFCLLFLHNILYFQRDNKYNSSEVFKPLELNNCKLNYLCITIKCSAYQWNVVCVPLKLPIQMLMCLDSQCCPRVIDKLKKEESYNTYYYSQVSEKWSAYYIILYYIRNTNLYKSVQFSKSMWLY